MKFNYVNLTPFKWFVLQNFPFIEADFDAITTYQLYCELVKYLNKVIESENLVGTQLENLTNAFNDLTDYVDNYFNNLDVQEEINNKLDEMAENGQLVEIISAYLELNALMCYNSLDDMKNATNLINGSFARIYGKLLFNDGQGAFYKIRELVNTDVVDNDNIVALTNFSTLVAEKIPNEEIANIKTRLTNVENRTTAVEERLDIIDPKLENISFPATYYKNKNLVVFGDSFSEPEIANSEDEQWIKDVVEATKMSRFNFAKAGAGFARTNNILHTQLETAISTMTSEQKNNTAIVIVYAGYNDIVNNINNNLILTNCITLIQDINTTFPNAKIILAPFNWGFNLLLDETNITIQTLINQISRNVAKYPCILLKFARYWNLGIKAYYRNAVHPNVNGYHRIASYMIGAIFGSSEHVMIGDSIPLLHGSERNGYYSFEDGKVTINMYAKFAEALTNYYGTMNESLPSLCRPTHDTFAPLLDANGNYVGNMRVGVDGIFYINIKSLNANTYCFMQPLTFFASANDTY